MRLAAVLLAALGLAACGGGDDDVDASTTPDSPGGADAVAATDGPPGDAPPPSCSVPATYAGATDMTSGYFVVNYDDNGGSPGDPIVGNDIQAAQGRLAAGPPEDLLFVNLYEGIATWADDGGAIRDFGSFELPLVVDLGADPEEQDYDTCGTCISILNAVTTDGGAITNYVAQLVARSGTITFTALPSAPGATFAATLDGVVLGEIDLNGDFVTGGCTTTLNGVTLTTTTPAGRTLPIARRVLGDVPRESRARRARPLT